MTTGSPSSVLCRYGSDVMVSIFGFCLSSELVQGSSAITRSEN